MKKYLKVNSMVSGNSFAIELNKDEFKRLEKHALRLEQGRGGKDLLGFIEKVLIPKRKHLNVNVISVDTAQNVIDYNTRY